jgi:hypothetical protein
MTPSGLPERLREGIDREGTDPAGVSCGMPGITDAEAVMDAAADEIERLRAELIIAYDTAAGNEQEADRLRALVECKDCMEYAQQLLAADRAENDRLRAENVELREALTECADDLQTELEYRYGYPLKNGELNIHPAVQRKFDRDMAPVERARAILARTAKD